MKIIQAHRQRITLVETITKKDGSLNIYSASLDKQLKLWKIEYKTLLNDVQPLKHQFLAEIHLTEAPIQNILHLLCLPPQID